MKYSTIDGDPLLIDSFGKRVLYRRYKIEGNLLINHYGVVFRISDILGYTIPVQSVQGNPKDCRIHLYLRDRVGTESFPFGGLGTSKLEDEEIIRLLKPLRKALNRVEEKK